MKEKILGLIQKGELDKAAKLTATSYEDSDSKFFMIRLNIIIKYGDKNSKTYYLMLNTLASDMVRFIEEEVEIKKSNSYIPKGEYKQTSRK
jgi:hypothetical protein